ncbi:MAG: ankyrin repeat domain-containing protein [Verrucomicrobiota bacterium]|nr:ankyrin repeat domain-containing protein [Verrucomicrobiota bacterium]
MKTRTTILLLLLLLLLSAFASAAEPAATEQPAKIEEAILAAARAGDAPAIDKLIIQSFGQRGSLDESAVKALLDSLVRSAELPAFTVLLGEMRKTTYGKDWQPDDALLGELVRDGRKDFIDAMLASWLDPARLDAKRDAGNAEMAEWMARRVAEVRKQRAEHDELVAAAGKGDLETMRRLLDSGVDVNCVAESRHTPLTLAARESRIEAVRLLLDRGATVDLPKHPGWDYTPLCLTKSVEVAELLKARGANVHAKLFKRDVSILTYIVRLGGAEMVEWMLEQGLDPKMIGDNKQNLLFDAGDARTVEILLAAGVDPNHVDEFGKTALASAQNAGVAQKLLEAEAKAEGDDSLITGMVYQFASAGAIETVIKARGRLDPAAAQKALIAAAHLDQSETAKLLLQHGAQANEAGKWGNSDGFDILPLMVCTVHGSPKTAKVLLEHGADPNAGKTPGLLLQNAIQNGHKEVAKILRDAGAKGVSDLAFYIAINDAGKSAELLKPRRPSPRIRNSGATCCRLPRGMATRKRCGPRSNAGCRLRPTLSPAPPRKVSMRRWLSCSLIASNRTMPGSCGRRFGTPFGIRILTKNSDLPKLSSAASSCSSPPERSVPRPLRVPSWCKRPSSPATRAAIPRSSRCSWLRAQTRTRSWSRTSRSDSAM